MLFRYNRYHKGGMGEAYLAIPNTVKSKNEESLGK